jgi:YesN/AraC family two-component response regulator
MSGLDLLRAIQREYPDVVTVLMSGSTLEQLPTPTMERAQVEHFIEKPWQQAEVNALLRELELRVLALRARKRDSLNA